jgi:hypothetical protein
MKFTFQQETLEKQLLDFKELLQFFDQFLSKNLQFVPEAEPFVHILLQQLKRIRGIDNVALAENIFHTGSVLIPTLQHVLQGILIIQLWASKALCDEKQADVESCQSVKKIVEENMELNLFQPSSRCLFEPDSTNCSKEWREARLKLTTKLNQFQTLFRDIIRVQMKRYMFNHKPVTKEELTHKYDPRVLEGKLTQVVENLMQNVHRRNTEFMSDLLPMISPTKANDLKRSLTQDESKLQQMQTDLQQRITVTLDTLKANQDAELAKLARQWRDLEVDFSEYKGSLADTEAIETYRQTYQMQKYGRTTELMDEMSELIDRKLDEVWIKLDTLSERVTAMQELINSRLASFLDYIVDIEQDFVLNAEAWTQKHQALQAELERLRNEEHQVNSVLQEALQHMHDDNQKKFQLLKNEQKAVAQELTHLRQQQQDSSADLILKNEHLQKQLGSEQFRLSLNIKAQEEKLGVLRQRIRDVERRVSHGELIQAETTGNVIQLKRSMFRHQVFAFFLSIIAILAYLWYNWEERTSDQIGFFEELRSAALGLRNAALGPLRRQANTAITKNFQENYTYKFS